MAEGWGVKKDLEFLAAKLPELRRRSLAPKCHGIRLWCGYRMRVDPPEVRGGGWRAECSAGLAVSVSAHA